MFRIHQTCINGIHVIYLKGGKKEKIEWCLFVSILVQRHGSTGEHERLKRHRLVKHNAAFWMDRHRRTDQHHAGRHTGYDQASERQELRGDLRPRRRAREAQWGEKEEERKEKKEREKLNSENPSFKSNHDFQIKKDFKSWNISMNKYADMIAHYFLSQICFNSPHCQRFIWTVMLGFIPLNEKLLWWCKAFCLIVLFAFTPSLSA